MPPVAPRSGDAIFANIERVWLVGFFRGYNIGIRLIDEFLAKSNVSRCNDFRETTDVIAKLAEINLQFNVVGSIKKGMLLTSALRMLVKKSVNRMFFSEIMVGFKMFLGVTASVTNWDADGTCCSIVLEDNPLVDFVELPDNCQGLYYCNILSGVIRGALDMVSMKTEVTWLRDVLRGDDVFELQVKLLKHVPEEYPYKDDE
ncbi:hypothetical protein V8G54_024201 [Vigna mungo]|uniref:Trafficking protein particle complex subunit n=1 Tax=Vigna mungo TaxID=3915 RepID=A0AAQ3N601_VIGMU